MMERLSKRHILFYLVTLLLLTNIYPKSIYGVNYQLEAPQVSTDLDSISPNSTEAKITIGKLIGARGESIFAKNGSVGMRGYPYMNSQSTPFRLQADRTALRLGYVNTKFSNEEKKVAVKVLFDTPGQQLLYIGAEQLPLSLSGEKINATQCNASIPCSTEKASIWNDDQMYGWGYHAEGSIVDADFGLRRYRQLEIIKDKSQLIRLAKDYQEAKNNTTFITIEAKLLPSMSKEIYTTGLLIIATPGY